MSRLGAVWDWVMAADRFVRLHFLIFSGVWPLMGAASVHPDLTAAQVMTLLAVTLCFHCFAMVLNDVIDLPIDRTEPRRRHDPLVRGVLRPWQALAFALIQPVLTVPLTMSLGGGWAAHTTLAVGFAAMAAYDVWGKRCPFPPFTDALQGVGWGSLAVYAAHALGAEPTALTWLVATYVAVFTVLFNGIHGPLRDLPSDLANGARTTAIYLGVRPSPEHGIPVLTPVTVIYGWTLLAALLAVHAAIIVRNDFGYGQGVWVATAAAAIAINAVIVWLHAQVLQPHKPVWPLAFRLQLYVITISLPLAFLAFASAKVALAEALLSALSLSLFEVTPGIVRWVWHTAGSALLRGPRSRSEGRGLNPVNDVDASH